MNSKHTTLLLWLLLITLHLKSQTITCPPNIDFELGNTSIWQYSTGTCCPIATPFTGAAIANRHTLMSGSGVDTFGGFPVVAPGSGSYSLKLGNKEIGAQAEKATYFVHVPPAISNYVLVYRYAVVFQDPAHTVSQQPRFEVTATDSATGAPLSCAHFVHIAAPGLPGFQVSPIASDVYYKDWASGVLNLSGYAGSTVRVEFATGDCSLGAHFGYGYLDMSCGLFAVSTSVCDTDSVTLTAPFGYHAYSWYNHTFTTLLDTGRTTRLPLPATTTTYAVVLHPYPGSSCSDTLFTSVIPSYLYHQPMRDTFTCGGAAVMLNPHVSSGSYPLTTTWSSPGAMSCPTCDSTWVNPTTPTTYVVNISNPTGCTLTDTVTVLPGLRVSTSPDTTLCDVSAVPIATSATGILSTLSYNWWPATGLGCSTCPATTATNEFTTTYIVTVSDTLGCTQQDSVRVRRGHTRVHIPTDTMLCASAPITLFASASDTGNTGPLTIAWTATGYIPCTTCSTMVVNPTVATTYMVTVTNSFGCTVADTLHIDVANMTVSVADDTLCDHSPHTINSSASGLFMPLSYSWWPTTGLSCTTCPAPVTSATTTVSYILTVTDTIGCTVKDTATIHRGKIDMNPMPDTTICHATGIVLAPEITGAAYSRTYNWGPATGLSCTNCAAPVASPSVTTTYMVTVTNSMGCTATQSATITSNYYQLIMPHDTVVCVGLETTLSLATTTPTTQLWSPATGLDTTAGPIITTNIENDITYHVTVTDTLGCTLTDSVEVKRNTLLIYPLEGKEICEEESIALARPATFDAYPVQYSWSPAADLDCATCETPTARPTRTTTYVMVATDETGCTHTDSVTINVEMCDIWFPNAFTPNADGKNDIARVVGHLRFYTDFSLYIYNRYGEVVFHTTDITAGWNGIFKDIPADLGVYFYKINYTLNGRTHMMKGDLTLVR